MADEVDHDTKIDAFDLPDGLEADHVTICPRENPDGPEYIAIPYVVRKTFDDGRRWLHESAEFTPTAAFAQAVANNADPPADEIKIGHVIPTRDLGEHEPL
mgnify:CR=1 FL=1